jgi:adenosylhomocysteine nucleosidase
LLAAGAEALVSWGCAAALDPYLAAGDLVLPAAIFDTDGTLVETHAGWRSWCAERAGEASLRVTAGILCTSPHVVQGMEAKLRLGRATGAVAVDMESGAVARTAAEAGIPVIAIRAIADAVDLTIPEGVIRALQPDGHVGIGKLLANLLLHPSEIHDLLRLGRSFRAAQCTLHTMAALAQPDHFFGGRRSGAEAPASE